MKPLIECLHDEEVGRLLTGEVDAARTSELEQHLADCIDCRQRLEQQVGDDGWWNETESSLRSQHVATHEAASLRDAEDVDPDAASLGETRLRESVLDLLGPTDDPNMLGRIGSYEIIGLLGQGGMGAVFKGFDRSLNRFVAIKMLLPHLAASGAARKRFAREGQAVAAVVDDHVMAIHCVDEWQGVPYLVMTYSRGVSLQKRLSDNGPLEVREILRIGMQAAKGLAAAHAQGIVHRDIKPANIFLDQNVERVQLMDFGLARAVDDASLTRSGTLAGTPQYMSPEQARAETVDHRSDLFSLGSVMYAMCTGHAPFRAESSYSVLRLITDKEPRSIREINSDIPDWLCTIINKLMAKQVSERFDCAKQVADLLEDCLAHVQQPTVKKLPESLTQHLVSRSGSSRPARLIQRLKQFGIRSWLLAGISVTAIMLIAMMLQDNLPQRSGQGESGPLTVAQANLNELVQQQKAREESIRQISYHGTVRQYAQQKIKRTNTESVDEFVARCVGLAPVYDDVPPYPLSASRDFNSGVYRFTMSDINMSIPKYMDWFIDKKKYVQLMGRDPGTCEAVVTKNREDIQDDRKASIVRLDIAAFRPVNDILMSEVVKNAVGVPGIPDVAGRPLWKLEKLDNKVGWKATFMFQQPIAKPPGAKQILWYRVYWEQIGGELVIVRVDSLPVLGDENSTPQSVTLIDDYRSVCGKPVPFRVRCFVVGDSFVQGAEFTVSDMKVNDYVDVPEQMQIPAGSPVRNQITGVKSRQPASKISDPTTDSELIQGTWNVLELQQVGYEPSEGERGFYKNGGYKITFTKNKSIHSPDHSSMEYRVDTTQTPHVLELLQSGKVIAKAIYELKGDDLKICQGRTPTDGSAPEPPTSFDINQAPTKFPTLYILRRTKPIEPIAIPMGVTASGAATKLSAFAVESDVSVALKIAVERDSSIPDEEWRSLDARNQAIDSRNVSGTPLTLMFLAMPKPATISKLMTDELEVFESATGAGILDEIERNKGPLTFIHKDRINEIEYKLDKDVAVGTFSFLAPGLYKGKIGFRARKMETDWSITEFKLNAYGVQLVRDGESWKTKTVAVSESKRDIEKLRGEWRVTNIRLRNQRPRSQDVEVMKFEDSSFLFTESHLTVTGIEKRVAEITLRDNASPKEIDLKATEGVGAGKTAYGIYRFDGDRLLLCIGEVRPVKFTDDDAGLLVLERRQISDDSLTTPAEEHRHARSAVDAYISATLTGDADKAAPAESPLLVEARKALQACQNSLSWKQKFDMRVTNSYVHSQVGKVTIESRVRRDAPRMVESSLQTFDDQPKDHIRLDNWRLDDGEMFISRTTTVGHKKLTGLMTIKGRQKASWRMFESSSSFAMEGHFPGNQGRTLMELLMESKEPNVRTEKIGGHDCLRISDSNDWGTMTVWIDAGPSRRLRQCESFKERGNRFADGRVGEDKDTANLESFSYFLEDIQYKAIDGIEIAVSCRVRSTSIPNGGAKQEASTEYRRTEIHLRPDFGTNNPFVGDFDNGARINDGDAFDRDTAFRWQDGKLTPLPNTKPSIVDENKRPSGKASAIDLRNARTVVEAYVAAAIAGDRKTVQAMTGGNSQEPDQRAKTIESLLLNLAKLDSLATKTVYVNTPDCPSKGIALSETLKWEDQINPSVDRIQVRLWFELSKSDQRWTVTEIGIEAEERADELLKKFLDDNPTAISVLPQDSTEKASGGNTKTLVLDCEEIYDLHGIMGLTQLEVLYINQFVHPSTDFKILKDLPHLRKLTFSKWSGLSSDEIETIKESLPGVEVVQEENQVDRKNARSVVEAYVALALAGDVAKAAALAKNSPSDPKRIAEIPKFLNVQRLKIQTVYLNDPATPTRAFATSQSVRLDEEYKQPDGQRDGFMVFTLELTDDKWFLTDIDFESEAGSEKELKRFLEANPNSIGLPPQSQKLSP